jgi:hypothetical protein
VNQKHIQTFYNNIMEKKDDVVKFKILLIGPSGTLSSIL